MFKYLCHFSQKVLVKYANETEFKIMNGFVIFSVSIFLYFRFHIFDQGACRIIVAPSINRDPSKTPTFAHFKDNFFHSLLVPPVTQISVQTSKHCSLQCLKNDGCFCTNVSAYPRPDGNFTCEVLNTDKYSVSEKFHPNQTFHHCSIVASRNDFF